jgi:hypothetical protein
VTLSLLENFIWGGGQILENTPLPHKWTGILADVIDRKKYECRRENRKTCERKEREKITGKLKLKG